MMISVLIYLARQLQYSRSVQRPPPVWSLSQSVSSQGLKQSCYNDIECYSDTIIIILWRVYYRIPSYISIYYSVCNIPTLWFQTWLILSVQLVLSPQYLYLYLSCEITLALILNSKINLSSLYILYFIKTFQKMLDGGQTEQ